MVQKPKAGQMMTFLQVALPVVIGWAFAKLLRELYEARKAADDVQAEHNSKHRLTWHDVVDMVVLNFMMRAIQRITKNGLERHGIHVSTEGENDESK